MADDKNQTTSQGGENKPEPVKPKPGVKPPKYDYVTEGFDPSQITEKVGGSDENE